MKKKKWRREMYGLACPIREGRNGMKGMPVVVWVWVLCAMFQLDG
jgi:hypothetical protein